MVYLVIILICLHGFIHLYGFASEVFLQGDKYMQWKTIHPFSLQTRKIFAIVWLLAAVILWLGASGILFEQTWWRIVALIGVILSQSLIILYFRYTWLGSVANSMILSAIIWLK